MAALDLPLDESRELLRDSIIRLLADTREPAWSDLAAKLGLAGLTVPESAGGFGGGIIDVALVMAELGPALAGADWLAHAAACRALALAAPAHPLLPALASGEDRAALVMVDALPPAAPAHLVPGAAQADLLVLCDGRAVAACAAGSPGLERRARAMHDGTLAAELHFSGLRAQPVGALPQGFDLKSFLDAARCAEAVGIMQRLLEETALWLQERRQFGAPIATFQSLRHRLADMKMGSMQAQALVEQAVIAVERGEADADAALAAARIMVRDAARIVGEGAVQLHGAMGLVEELRLGARFKRLLVIAATLGSEADVMAAYCAAA